MFSRELGSQGFKQDCKKYMSLLKWDNNRKVYKLQNTKISMTDQIKNYKNQELSLYKAKGIFPNDKNEGLEDELSKLEDLSEKNTK